MPSLGVASFGHFSGTHYQNHHGFAHYVGKVNAGELPIYRTLTPSDGERLIREFILQLKLGHLSCDYFTKKISIDPRAVSPLRCKRCTIEASAKSKATPSL